MKLYTVFNLYGGHLQLPSGAYLAPKGDPRGMDRAYPVEVPEGHVLWKLASPAYGDPNVKIVEGDVPHTEPEKATKAPPPAPKVPVPSKPTKVKAEPEPPSLQVEPEAASEPLLHVVEDLEAHEPPPEQGMEESLTGNEFDSVMEGLQEAASGATESQSHVGRRRRRHRN